MFKSLLIILALLFTSVYAQDSDLSKSFTANCETNDSSACTYSLVLTSTSTNSGYMAAISIVIGENNTYYNPVVIANSANPQIFNIPVMDNEQVLINFQLYDQSAKTLVIYTIHNQADGNGKVIITSRSRQIMVYNPCETGSCQFDIIGYSSTQQAWPENLFAVVTVNGQIKATITTAGIMYPFPVLKEI